MKRLRACLMLCWCGLAQAGFDDAVKAYEARDYTRALEAAEEAARGGDARGDFMVGQIYQLGQGVSKDLNRALAAFEKAAKAGVARASTRLARAYLRGEGVAKDSAKALEFARQAARGGDPEGSFMVSALLFMGPLNDQDAAGAVDEARRQARARRAVSERSLETEAFDALYQSASQGYPQARAMLAKMLSTRIGEGNRRKMLKLTDVTATDLVLMLRRYRTLARQMEELGNSLASPLLFDEARQEGLARMQQKCGQNGAGEGGEVKLVSTLVTSPPAQAVYLPSQVPGFEKAYLAAGHWQETWVFTGCGQRGTWPLLFTADGLGGARFEFGPPIEAGQPEAQN